MEISAMYFICGSGKAIFFGWLYVVAAFCCFSQSTRENTRDMINDIRNAVDGADPDRNTFAYSDK